MLIENKFFYISLPRCASTSFMATCVKYNLEIKHYSEHLNIDNQSKVKNLDQIDYEHFQNEFAHAHEKLNHLREKFGSQYDIISVKRNKYERFISLWKHILHEMDLKEHNDTYKKCIDLKLNELLFYNNYDLMNPIDVNHIVQEFIKKYDLKYITNYGQNMLRILVKPYSAYHLHDPNIIWFDFNKLNKLEEWVSNKLNMDFKLLKINSSNHYKPNFELNDEFKEKYDSIYKIYDDPKIKKTFI